LNFKAEVESSISQFGFKRSVPGAFNLGFIGSTCTALPGIPIPGGLPGGARGGGGLPRGACGGGGRPGGACGGAKGGACACATCGATGRASGSPFGIGGGGIETPPAPAAAAAAATSAAAVGGMDSSTTCSPRRNTCWMCRLRVSTV